MLKKLLIAAGAAVVGAVIGVIVKKRNDKYETVTDVADEMTETACNTVIDILKEGCGMAVKDKIEMSVGHAKTVAKMTFGYGIQSDDILKMSKNIDPEFHDEFFKDQLNHEKLAKNIGSVCMITCGIIFVGCIGIKLGIYEHALTKQDEYLLIHRVRK